MKNSKIEWTDTTWNPLAGCTRVSAGCDNCYAAAMTLRLEAMALADKTAGRRAGAKEKYIGIASRTRSGRAAFNGKINLDHSALDEPSRWQKPRRVFVNSMSDLFHENVPDTFIARAFAVMVTNPQHTFQILTKRPQRAAEWFGGLTVRGGDFVFQPGWGIVATVGEWPAKNIWIGTSVEDQSAADERIPHLLSIPAAVRFLSIEPLLGPVNIERYLYPQFAADDHRHYPWRNGVEWVIVGGESGKQARPMQIEWAEEIKQQCDESGSPAFFMKQLGGTPDKRDRIEEFPDHLQVREFPTTQTEATP